jgi:hypothetical protein
MLSIIHFSTSFSAEPPLYSTCLSSHNCPTNHVYFFHLIFNQQTLTTPEYHSPDSFFPIRTRRRLELNWTFDDLQKVCIQNVFPSLSIGFPRLCIGRRRETCALSGKARHVVDKLYDFWMKIKGDWRYHTITSCVDGAFPAARRIKVMEW